MKADAQLPRSTVRSFQAGIVSLPARVNIRLADKRSFTVWFVERSFRVLMLSESRSRF